MLSQEEVEGLRRVTDEFVEKSRQVSENDDVFDLEPAHSPEAPRLRRLKDPANQHPAYDRAMRHQGILDIVAQLVGPSIRCNGQKLNVKAAGFGSPVEWHQDGRFVGAITEEDFDPSHAEKVELEAGGISIHHVRALHGSLPNLSSRSRRLLLFQYCAGDAWPLLGESWETWEDALLRGEPTCQPRVTDVPVRMPLPPPLRGGSIYETQTELRRSTLEAREG